MFGLLLLAASAASATAPRAQASNDWSPKCLTCKMVVSIVEKYLKNGKKVEEIVEKVQQYCSYVSGEGYQVCLDIVKEKVPQIISYIEKEMETHNVCSILDYCK